MKTRHRVSVTWALAASIMACLALLSLPSATIAADPSDSSADVADGAAAPLARGSGYGRPQGDPRVRALQRRLRALGHQPGPVDGLYGRLTEAAVERMQRDSGLGVDGIVGPQTRRVLKAAAPPLVPGAGYGQPGGSPRVRDLQRSLRALGQRPGSVDGLYGGGTQAAIERFQRTAGLSASGVLSPATAVALARADGRQQRGERAAGEAVASPADDRPRRADRGNPVGGTDQGRTRTRIATTDRTGTEGAESMPPVLWALLVLVLAAMGGLLASWLRGRHRRPRASGVAVPAGPGPIPAGGSTAVRLGTGPTAPPSAEQGRRRTAAAAIGYVSVREPEAGEEQELRDQLSSIAAACRRRGLVLKDVIGDREPVNDAGARRPGMEDALQRLAAGEASCLVVSELGRLSSSALEIGYILASLQRRKARLVAVGDRLDTGTMTGAGAADKLVSLCTVDGRHHAPVPEQRPSEGPNGNSGPGAHHVRELKERIRAMRARGMTLQAIADQLNAENVPTLRGGATWRPSGVQAAAGYRRPVPADSPQANGGEGEGNDSFGARRRSSRRPASSRTGRAVR